ncbi:hypothetical protein PFISCL1PPCAC_3927, partial [Pristionchus fissidentatus]
MKRPAEELTAKQQKKKRPDIVVLDDDSDYKVKGEYEKAPPTHGEFAALQEKVKRLEQMFQFPIPHPTVSLGPTREEIDDLQEKLKKTEEMFKRACRAAKEAELRAERAENLLDAKYGVMESVEKLKEKNKKLKVKKDELKEENQELRGKNEQLENEVSGLKKQLEKERETSGRQKLRADELDLRVVELEKRKSGEKKKEVIHSPSAVFDSDDSDEEEHSDEEEKAVDSPAFDSESEGEEDEKTSGETFTVSTIDPLSILRPSKNESGQMPKDFVQLVLRLIECNQEQLESSNNRLFQRVMCDLCDVPIKSGYGILRHLIGPLHQWNLSCRRSGVSSAAIEYWRKRINENDTIPDRVVLCSNISEFHYHSLDLHLMFCSNPSHQRVDDVPQKLFTLKERWNGLSEKNKEIVMNGKTKRRIRCPVCDGRCVVNNFFNHISENRHLMNVSSKGVKVCEESVNAWSDRFRRLNQVDESSSESEDEEEEEEE